MDGSAAPPSSTHVSLNNHCASLFSAGASASGAAGGTFGDASLLGMGGKLGGAADPSKGGKPGGEALGCSNRGEDPLDPPSGELLPKEREGGGKGGIAEPLPSATAPGFVGGSSTLEPALGAPPAPSTMPAKLLKGFPVFSSAFSLTLLPACLF